MLRGERRKRRTIAGLILLGGVGALCGLLVELGNPANMGICGACFLRDLAGSLGLIGGPGPKIFRPEVVGVLLGALVWVFARRGFAARSGGHAATRFFFGVWLAFAALVFLGCPFRMLQRIGGGDLNAWVAAVGFVGGVGVGLLFERRGYGVGRTQVVAPPVGLLGPLVAVLLLVAFFEGTLLIGPGPGAAGPPAHAPWSLALGLALIAGVVLSATGFCAVSAARQVFLRDRRMLAGAGLLVLGYAVVALATSRFHLGVEGQPVAHDDALWNVLAGALIGLTGVLAGGCPVRQIVMAGEGNGDAFLTVMGLVVGGGLAHNLGIVSTPSGPTEAGRAAVILGLAIALAYAAAMTVGRRAGPASGTFAGQGLARNQ